MTKLLIVLFSAAVGIASVNNRFVDLLLDGSPEERHTYAKGLPTQYGCLPFDAEFELKKAGLSDRDVHVLGYLTGFSTLR